MTWRKEKAINTPASWHRLVHAGAEKCVEAAKQNDGHFDVHGTGKDKKGADLSAEELKHFARAADDCTGCKQLKMSKPRKVSHSRSALAERSTGSGHGSRRG